MSEAVAPSQSLLTVSDVDAGTTVTVFEERDAVADVFLKVSV